MSDAVQAAIEKRERATRGEPEPKEKKAPKAKPLEEESPFEEADGAAEGE